MFTRNVRRLYQPSVRQCCDCHEYKVAIAYQIIPLRRTGGSQIWWICRDCGQSRGIFPTPELSRRLRRMEEKKRAEQRAKVIVLPPRLTTISKRA
ncbi:hypothetical protein [Acaryochloris marina]|uniref:hypothetical protein n=1 Tax=Acaryochloris marina TaxID=155978 RepID=UPI0021C2A147|nr:hypothetical protein [Acaryochloris marina]